MDKGDYWTSKLSNVTLNFDQWKEIHDNLQPNAGSKLWWLSLARMSESAVTFDQWEYVCGSSPPNEPCCYTASTKMLELAKDFDQFLKIAHISPEHQDRDESLIGASKLAVTYDQWSRIRNYSEDRCSELAKLAIVKMSELAKTPNGWFWVEVYAQHAGMVELEKIAHQHSWNLKK